MTARSYTTSTGRPAAHMPFIPRARAPRPVERNTVRVLHQGARLLVHLECGHRVEVDGPAKPPTAMCTECGEEGRC